jgi:hypothetical protein
MKSILLGINLLGLGVALVITCPAQVAQNHPELCGRPGASIPVPEGVRWQPPDDDLLTSTLFLRNRDGETRINLEVWPSMDQICAVSGDQLVLFGELNDNYGINRIDRRTATIIDGFSGRDPMMSPDQHWLIRRPYRHFRSQRSDSEEYLLYDLTVSADKNITKGLTLFTQGLIGRPVYPIPHDGVPFEFEDQPPEMTHTFRSDAFHWAPDSSAVAFADSVMDKLSMVVVKVQPAGPSTLVLPVDVSGLCEPQVGDNADYPIPTVSGVDFGSSRTLIIQFAASTFCKSAQMSLRLDDFRAPRPEIHTPTPARRGPAPTLDGIKIDQK